MHIDNQPSMKPTNLDDDYVLFNFRWKRIYISKLHKIAKYRGISASALIKNLLLNEYKQENALKEKI